MERLHGFKIDDDAGIVEAGLSPSPVYRALMVSFFEGAMVHGVFHGDLHGGNMIVTLDGKAGIFDFGITGRFEGNARQALLGMMMSGVTEDVGAQRRFFRDLGGFPADANLDQIAAELNLEEIMTTNQSDVPPEQLAAQMRMMMTKLVAHGARLPKELFLYMKGMIYLNGAIAALAPDVDIFAELGHVFEYFTTAHGDRFVEEIGLDLNANPFDGEAFQEHLRRQVGTDAASLTYREMQELQNSRMQEVRAARRRR
jgi:ubiquinone biosynthesis protein